LRINSTISQTIVNSKQENTYSKIYPNPATMQITIESASFIQSVSIIGELTPQRKVVRVNGQKSITINLANLQPGIYNCQITTQKGIENQKLIIKR
jgi:Secretion system C-terminal sorting domain